MVTCNRARSDGAAKRTDGRDVSRRQNLVTLNFASWNRMAAWLCQLVVSDALRDGRPE